MDNPNASSPALTPTEPQVNAALLAIRIAGGIAFIYHGCAILFGAFGGPGLDGFAAYMHVSMTIAFLVGLAQLCGGLALLSGILARLGAACIVIVMLGAILMVHWPKGFDVTKGGMEYALTQLLIGVAILFTGAGAYSLAAWLPASWLKAQPRGFGGPSSTYPTGRPVGPTA